MPPVSTDRILTTHSGSVPRTLRLQQLLLDRQAGKEVPAGEFDDACQEAATEAVNGQARSGVDVVNDGDQSKTGFAAYITERVTGFDGPPEDRVLNLEQREFPEWAGTRRGKRQPCTGPIEWKDFSMVTADVKHLQAAVDKLDQKPAGVFMTSVSPGTFTNHNPNRYYPSDEEYLTAVADVMKREYDAIAQGGFIVQLDSPDLAARSNNFPDMELSDWRKIVARNIEAIGYATRDIPEEQVRVHVCWGANAGPHNHDTQLKDIQDLLLKARGKYLTVVAANGRHEFEWQAWQDVKLPDGKVIIPGVIDSTTTIIEHPETVAERITRFANVLGRENIIAGVDCGFGTSVSPNRADPKIVWAKLSSLAQGAAIASKKLWGSN
jgi:5-methyltetrahydropteroyltriglutamate--homocysteine methyltransferase